ncbi:hypothetical protein RFI_27392 [Reticulomyxa filosa]|uniref:Uncharacterized protein n=1 Tax=Reticulomyxa filosa TaxID=46433 RepID=X6M7U9_RETFI|nr:hypothetical protein RFI_27392 [Reticulomyxa filosa]|eukprot:ETO09984.1 hypothetical protein RFI_27392 [Reticulomyxa filosa]
MDIGTLNIFVGIFGNLNIFQHFFVEPTSTGFVIANILQKIFAFEKKKIVQFTLIEFLSVFYCVSFCLLLFGFESISFCKYSIFKFFILIFC